MIIAIIINFINSVTHFEIDCKHLSNVSFINLKLPTSQPRKQYVADISFWQLPLESPLSSSRTIFAISGALQRMRSQFAALQSFFFAN